jgi:hypothetical protein
MLRIKSAQINWTDLSYNAGLDDEKELGFHAEGFLGDIDEELIYAACIKFIKENPHLHAQFVEYMRQFRQRYEQNLQEESEMDLLRQTQNRPPIA